MSELEDSLVYETPSQKSSKQTKTPNKQLQKLVHSLDFNLFPLRLLLSLQSRLGFIAGGCQSPSAGFAQAMPWLSKNC